MTDGELVMFSGRDLAVVGCAQAAIDAQCAEGGLEEYGAGQVATAFGHWPANALDGRYIVDHLTLEMAYGSTKEACPLGASDLKNQAMEKPLESDWKKFRALIPVLRERYLAERNAEIVRLLTAPNKDETDRFWDAEAQVLAEAKALRRCLDDISRSKMWLTLISMRNAGMLKKEDLAAFSEDLQKRVFFEFPT